MGQELLARAQDAGKGTRFALGAGLCWCEAMSRSLAKRAVTVRWCNIKFSLLIIVYVFLTWIARMETRVWNWEWSENFIYSYDINKTVICTGPMQEITMFAPNSSNALSSNFMDGRSWRCPQYVYKHYVLHVAGVAVSGVQDWQSGKLGSQSPRSYRTSVVWRMDCLARVWRSERCVSGGPGQTRIRLTLLTKGNFNSGSYPFMSTKKRETESMCCVAQSVAVRLMHTLYSLL